MTSKSNNSELTMTEVVATACYTQNKSTIVKRHLKTPYEIFHKGIPNINFLHVFGCPVYIHNHKHRLGKFDEKAYDGYLLGHSLVSKAFRVFNTRRQQIEETYNITFNERPNVIKFLKPSVDNINIAQNERYPHDEYLHPYKPSQMNQTNSNDVSFIEPYECPKAVVLETEDTLVENTIPIPNPLLPIPSVVTPVPQDIWSQDKHIEMVNIIDFVSKEEPKKVEFSFDEISFTTNNEVALINPSHSNSEYFEIVSDFISKCCLKEAFTRAPTQCGKTSGLDQISNKDATILYCLANKVISVHNWALKPNQTEGPPFTDHMKGICNLDVHVDSKAPKPSLQTEEVPQGKKPKAKSGLKRKQSLKHTSESKTEVSKSKTGQSEKETQSSLAKDKIPSHPSPPTLVVGKMHKEAQQAAGGPTSLGATSKEGAHPQLCSADSTTEADPRLSAPNDSIPSQQGINEESIADEISKKIKLEDLSDLLKDTRSAFFTPDSPQDEPIIVSDESEEEETEKAKDTHATSHNISEDTSVPHPPSPKSAQIQELMAQVQLLQSQKDELEQQKEKAKAEITLLKSRPSYPDIYQFTNLLVSSLKPEFSKLLASHDFASCLRTKLKELPSKFTELSRKIKYLKKHVAELKYIQWELPTEFFDLPIKVYLIQENLKTLDSLQSLLNKVTDTLNRFSTMVENTSGAACNNVPLAGKATTSPTEEEKNTNPATRDAEQTNMHNELVNLLGIDIVTQYYNKKLLYDKYCDKMLKRRKSSKIINCDVLTQKGPITLQVYKEDGIVEVI
ncbi:retrovirus-related pol polyprotein from transposon TNT 1-94 [Tanacetum coccineum]